MEDSGGFIFGSWMKRGTDLDQHIVFASLSCLGGSGAEALGCKTQGGAESEKSPE